MYWVYLIQHELNKKNYIGKTTDIKRRIKEHNSGKQKSTKTNAGEWKLIYAELYRSKKDADEREQKLKQHGSNLRWLKDRVKNSLLQ